MLNAGNVSLEVQLHQIIAEYRDEVAADVEAGLTEASQLLVSRLLAASPRSDRPDMPHLQDNWDRKLEYKGVRYVGNTKTVPRPKLFSSHKGGIPLSSLLEFSSKGHPFIQRTFDASHEELTALIVRKIGG
ncbi:MAG: hypothetical protein A2Y16_05390 [Tenericutes bacterium GWF2_57_13]|nr:MAG: hypothetical protein A2Y16_05390 [Tenericutes bacterium GWF2_57_13]